MNADRTVVVHPRGARPWSVVAVVVAVAGSGALAGVGVAAWVLAGAAFVAGLLRLVAPQWSPVRVRTRLIDALTLWLFAAALGYLAATAPLG